MYENFKKMTDIELLILYREREDMMAYRVLYDRYLMLSRAMAGDIIDEYRSDFLLEFNMLVSEGMYAFVIACKNFNVEMKSFRSYWRKISYSMMKNISFAEMDFYKTAAKKQMLEERCGNTSKPIYSNCFSDGGDGMEKILMDDIKSVLFDPKHKIKPIIAALFLEYLNGDSIGDLSEKFHLSQKTVHRKIDSIRKLIMTKVLGEKI